MSIDEEMKELREAINIESHIALQLNTLLCKCNVCNAIGNLYIFLTIFKEGDIYIFPGLGWSRPVPGVCPDIISNQSTLEIKQSINPPRICL